MQNTISKFFKRQVPSDQDKVQSLRLSDNVVDLCGDDDTSPQKLKITPNRRFLSTLETFGSNIDVVEADVARHTKFAMAVSASFDEVNAPEQNKICSTGMQKVKYTPLEMQVVSLRAAHPDTLLMAECGYRMRFFGDDATVAAKVLSIFAHRDHNFMVASIPTFRTYVHCKQGYKVHYY